MERFIDSIYIQNKIRKDRMDSTARVGQDMDSKSKLSTPVKHKLPRRMPKYCATAVLILTTLLVMLAILLNVLMDMSLFEMGLNFVHHYQTNQPQQGIKVIQNIISILGSQVVTALIVIYLLVSKRKLQVLIHLICFVWGTYFIGLLSQSIQQSRPHWFDIRIQNYDKLCPMTFGNPSGHSYAIIMLYEPMLSDSIGYGKFKFMSIFLVLLWVLIPISRMYLGSHSANQVLFGIVVGLCFLIIFKYVFQKLLYDLCWGFLTKSSVQKRRLLTVVLVNILCFIIPIIFFFVLANNNLVPQREIVNLNKKCETNRTGQQIQQQIFVQNAIGGITFGVIYGFIFLKNKSKYRHYYLGHWEHVRKWKILLKVGVYIVCVVIPFLAFYLTASYAIKNVPLPHYIVNYIATLVGGFGLSFLVPVVAFKFKIIRQYQEKTQAEKRRNIQLGQTPKNGI